MKKISQSLMALSLVVPATALIHSGDNVNALTQKEVSSYSLNVRTGPGANYKVADWLKKGQVVNVLNTNKGWDYVSFSNGKKGYVNDAFLKNSTNHNSDFVASSVDTRSVNAYRLTLRNGPGADYKAIDYLKQGANVTVLSQSGSWAQVSINGEIGYVNANYLSAAKVAEAPTTYTKYVNTPGSRLNLRSGRGVQNSIVVAMNNGSVVKVSNIQNGWAQVQYGNYVGYASVDYLSDSAPQQPTTPVNNGSLSGKLIVIDPGHGGKDSGAQGYADEHKVVYEIATKVQAKLQAMGARVILTRTANTSCSDGSYYETLACRPNIATKNKADAFVSIHANSGNPAASGTESWYYNAGRGDQKLATTVLNDTVKYTGEQNRGVKPMDWAVLVNSTVPSTLVETGFVTNQSDAYKLNNDSYQDKFAEGIAQGIKDYFN